MGQIAPSDQPIPDGTVSPIPLKNSMAEAFYPSAKAEGELVAPAFRPAWSAARGRDHAMAP